MLGDPFDPAVCQAHEGPQDRRSTWNAEVDGLVAAALQGGLCQQAIRRDARGFGNPDHSTARSTARLSSPKSELTPKSHDEACPEWYRRAWLEFSLACGYLDQSIFDELFQAYEHILGKLNNMERKADTFCF